MIRFAHSYRQKWRIYIIPALLAVLISACSKTETVSPPTVDPPTVDEAVAETGWFPTATADSNSFAIARFDSAGTDLRCTIYEGYQVVVASRLTHLAPRDDIHYPGSVLQWASLDQPTPLMVVAERAGATLRLMNADSLEVTGEVPVIDPETVDA